MAAWHYPPLEMFVGDAWKDPGCGCKAKASPPRGPKKRRKPDEPACYGPHCGDAARNALRKLNATLDTPSAGQPTDQAS